MITITKNKEDKKKDSNNKKKPNLKIRFTKKSKNSQIGCMVKIIKNCYKIKTVILLNCPLISSNLIAFIAQLIIVVCLIIVQKMS